MATIGTSEAAERLGIKRETVARWCREKKIPGAEQDGIGKPWHIPESSIDEMVKKKKK